MNAEPGTLALPMDLLLELREAAVLQCRMCGLSGDGLTAARALAAAAGVAAGLDGIDEAAARRLQREINDAFRRALEATGAAGLYLEGRRP